MSNQDNDQLIAMAQVMSEENKISLEKVLSGYLPLTFIIVAGLGVCIFSFYITNHWQSEFEKKYVRTTEALYSDEIFEQLGKLEDDTRIIVGFIKASEHVSDAEFKIFSNSLTNQYDQSNLMGIFSIKKDLSYSQINSTDQLPDELTALTPEQIFTLLENNAEQRDGGEYFILNNADNEQIILFTLPFESRSSGLQKDWILAATSTKSILDNAGLEDDISSLSFSLEEPQTSSDEHSYQYHNLYFSLYASKSAPNLVQFDSLRYLLMGSSLLFTVLLCIQFIFAQRSMRRLAKLAVERSNDLTTINNDLADEIMSRVQFQAELLQKTHEIQEANDRLEEVQTQLIQQEKLASLGQLAAGVAHEINNPVGFINSNLAMLKKYSDRTINIVDNIDAQIKQLGNQEIIDSIDQIKRENRYDNTRKNLTSVIEESQEGVDRVKQIVQDLRDFSRIDEAEWQWADIHSGIDSTLNIAWNEIKYKAEVHKDYGDLPDIECVPSQINQVIMNLLVNSAHAMETSGNIYIRTSATNTHVKIEVEDDGCGMPDEILGKVFDPFFTTKEVGKGTGLGLSLSYGIIGKHNGELNVKSSPGKGTTFTIILPITQSRADIPLKAGGSS